MGTGEKWLIPLIEAAEAAEYLVGSKAVQLGRIARTGHRVPDGFVLTALSYERFIREAGLIDLILMELGRKPLADMRWEEIWDAALRIRSAFLSASMPQPLAEVLAPAVDALGDRAKLAVRSSAPGEDSADRSFAGLHESFLGIEGSDGVLDAVRLVWASLWSDAALLYRKELSLDPVRSRMAVIVQKVVEADCSGVAFGRDPRDLKRDHQIVEAVPGPCSDLVDGIVDPDRWVLNRSSGDLVEYRRGLREESDEKDPILDPADLEKVHATLNEMERYFGWPPDLEWTGRLERFTLLQARPITTGSPRDETREWYLSLRPAPQKLKQLSQRVARELIPRLQREGQELAAENLDDLDDSALAGAIENRLEALHRWREIYRDEFIPFAHGVRRLATYYNDSVQPEDPYEFVGLLQGESMLASSRNQALERLASILREDDTLRETLQEVTALSDQQNWVEKVRNRPGIESFVRELESFEQQHLDTAFAGERLADRPDLLIAVVLQLLEPAEKPGLDKTPSAVETAGRRRSLEARLLDAVGEGRRSEAMEVLEIGRLSWRLRDDDNLLLGRVESQLLRSLDLAAKRLGQQGRLKDLHPGEKDAPILVNALRHPSGGPVELKRPEGEGPHRESRPNESPRQLTGQPAAPGIATGLVRTVRGAEDLARFQANEILVCDSIQPNMTHLVPLASAIVERRGGMLIHGAIIAREIGIPCVNGVPKATQLLKDGDLVTVDGHLGIVTVGAAEFELEKMLGSGAL